MALISLKETSGILNISEDDVMFLHQTNVLQARANMETLAWEFELAEVLEHKKTLDES